MQLKELFQRIDFFSGLDDKILRKLADAAVTRQYDKDEPIVRQGEMGLGLYIIVRGRVKVLREQPNGPPIKVAELGPEQFFAEMSIVDNKPRSATVTTMEECECLLLTRDSFVSLMQKYPEIPIRVARLLAERLRAADERLTALEASEPVEKAKAVAATNGDAPASGDAGHGAKDAKEKVKVRLLDIFENLYTMKAFTRFSVAVLGCPVEGSANNVVEQFRIGEVKALLLPADEPVSLSIAADRPGHFTLDLFTPGRPHPLHFGPVAIRPEDRVELSVKNGDADLHQRASFLP